LTNASSLQSKLYTLLGAISYPIYVIHMPPVLWVSAIFPRVFGRGLATIAPWSGLALVGLIAMLSYLLDRIYDQPVRRWLRHRFNRAMKR
jgi:peptidoglycan/LPS O-acetylase OafA/YrhL